MYYVKPIGRASERKVGGFWENIGRELRFLYGNIVS